jgi:hypothetical protein
VETRWKVATVCTLCAMAGEAHEHKKRLIVPALANGSSVAAFMRANDVPRRSAYRWAHDPKVRVAVERFRRLALDRAIGQMSRRATWAVNGIVKLAESADTDSVRLKAYRAIFADMMSVSKYSGLETRMAVMEEKLGKRAAAGTPPVK